MRILFTFIGGRGHLQPLIPVARAAAAAGHVVAVAGSRKQGDHIRAAGLEAIATGAPVPTPEQTGPTRDLTPLQPVDPRQDERDFVESFARRGARRHATAVLDVVRRWRPDVLVRDEADFGSGVAAERAGVPCVVLLVLAAGSLLRRDLVVGPLAELRDEHGLAPEGALAMLDGDLVLCPFPPSFRHPDSPLPSGSFAFRPGQAAPARRPSDAGPVIYFTLGTSFNSRSGDLIERVLAGLHDLPGRVVATLGRDVDPSEVAPQPDHVRLERFVDQAELLSGCDLVISHGGSGSVVGALAHGLPTLLLPLGADQAHNAERVSDLGVGRGLDSVHATPGDVRDAVLDLLGDPVYRAAAAEIAAEIAAQPGVEGTVPRLESIGSGAGRAGLPWSRGVERP
ncbi:MAG: glycosyltransferase [Nocardioides sp.]